MVESWVGLLIEFCERLPWNCLKGLDRESKGIRWFYLLIQTDLYHGTRTRMSDMARGMASRGGEQFRILGFVYLARIIEVRD